MNGDDLVDVAEVVATRDQFIEFLKELEVNLIECRSEWENHDIQSFIGGLRRFLASSDGYYRNFGLEVVDASQPSWRLFADAMLAAKVYE